MAHSLEIRLPFLDHRIVELAVALPARCQFQRGWTKSLLRQSFPELPKVVRWRKDKQGFITPEELWIKRDLAGVIERSFQKSLLDEFGVLDSKAFTKQYSSFRRGSVSTSFRDFSRAFIAELWAQQHWGLNSDLQNATTPA